VTTETTIVILAAIVAFAFFEMARAEDRRDR
jgi:hypothetical protein